VHAGRREARRRQRIGERHGKAAGMRRAEPFLGIRSSAVFKARRKRVVAIEEQARRELGLIKPGEVLFIVKDINQK
jgi:hypothetical protein